MNYKEAKKFLEDFNKNRHEYAKEYRDITDDNDERFKKFSDALELSIKSLSDIETCKENLILEIRRYQHIIDTNKHAAFGIEAIPFSPYVYEERITLCRNILIWLGYTNGEINEMLITAINKERMMEVNNNDTCGGN